MVRSRSAFFRLAVFATSAAFAFALACVAARAAEPEDKLKDELLKLNNPLGENAQTTKILAFVKDKERAKKALVLAYRLQKEAKGEDKPFTFSGSIFLARSARALKQYREAEFFYDVALQAASKLESGEKILKAHQGLIDLYWDTHRFDDVVDVCERFAKLTGLDEVNHAKPLVAERLARAKARSGKTEEALRIAEELIQRDEGGWYFWQLKGWVQREAGDYDDAIETYLDALKKLDASKRIPAERKDQFKDNLRYNLSGIYLDAKQIDKAAEQLLTLIKRDPDNPTYKNDLGFIWADNDIKLEEGEKLIKEAIELDQKRQEKLKHDGAIEEITENAAYQDSLGWVLFKQKKFKDALEPLKKATMDTENASRLEFWRHLGDCYMALGQKKEATDAWQTALTMGDNSKKDFERRQKVIAALKAAGVEPKATEPRNAERKRFE